MRVLSSLFFSLIVLLLLGGSAFFVVREVLLFMGVNQVRNSVTVLRNISKNVGVYHQECRKKGIIDPAAGVDAIQLRFVSPTEYAVEVVCAQFSLNPIEVSREKLPMFVTTTPGSSGLTWNKGLSAVGIQVWGRSRAIFVEEGDIWYGQVSEGERFPGPATVCEGHGYSCCQAETSVGTGGTIEGVTDCPRSCYAQCTPRPVLLSLSSQPFYDQKTRTINLKSGDPLEIGYVIDPQESAEVTVVIDYGDGSTEELPDANGRGFHTYNCPTGACQYTLSVQATDPTGIQSLVTPISQIKVVVN